MRWIVEALWLAAGAIAHATFGQEIALLRAVPILPLITVVRIAITSDELAGNLSGFGAGFLLDLFSLECFGASMLVGSAVGYTLGVARKHLVIGNLATRGIILLVSAEVFALGVVLIKSARGAPGPEPFITALGSGIYTALVGIAWWFCVDLARAIFGWRGLWDGAR